LLPISEAQYPPTDPPFFWNKKDPNTMATSTTPVLVIRSMLLLFVMVSTNHVGDLLGCSTRRLLTHTWAKHLMAYLVLVIFVVAIDGAQYSASYDVAPSLFVLGLSALAYLLFFLTTKCHSSVLVVVALLGMAVVLLDIEIKQAGEEKRALYQDAQYYTAMSLLPLLLLGFLLYARKQYQEHTPFRLSQFLSSACPSMEDPVPTNDTAKLAPAVFTQMPSTSMELHAK
jgi:hypothetical protein